jgi:hypothetical protein
MLKTEPVLFAGLARLAVLAAAYFGFHVDADTLLAAFGAIELVIVPLVRARVTPVAKVPGKPTLAALVFMCCVALFGCSGCGGPVIPPDVANIADPMLRVLGFCQRNGAEASEVAALIQEYQTGDKVNAALRTAVLLDRVSKKEGVEIPPEIDAAYRAGMGVILDGMTAGLRALDCRDANGKPVEGCK